MQHRLLLAAAALCAVLLAGVAAPSASSQTGTCTAVLRPGGSLADFTAALKPGDTGCLAPGTYREDKLAIRQTGNRSQPITLTSLDLAHPALIQGVFWIADSANYWTISHLRFDGRSSSKLPSPIVNGDHTTWTYDDVTNHHQGDPHDGGHGICFLLGSPPGQWGIAVATTITHSRIHDCGASSNHNHGIYIEETGGTTRITNNFISGNGDRGIQFYPDGHNVLIEHNTIVRNGEGVIFSGIAPLAAHGNRATGNIIADSTVRWNVESYYDAGAPTGHDNIVAGNCLWATSPAQGGYYQGAGNGGVAPQVGFTARNNKVAQPLFADPGHGDYRQRAGSGCIGYGVSSWPVGA